MLWRFLLILTKAFVKLKVSSMRHIEKEENWQQNNHTMHVGGMKTKPKLYDDKVHKIYFASHHMSKTWKWNSDGNRLCERHIRRVGTAGVFYENHISACHFIISPTHNCPFKCENLFVTLTISQLINTEIEFMAFNAKANHISYQMIYDAYNRVLFLIRWRHIR